jgi:UDP-N-acetylmuramoyl-tripeptide--D-alanyl-D-alanine ligase
VIKRTLNEISAMISAYCAENYGKVKIEGVSTDSRALHTGNLFIPLVGEHFDGHAYVQSSLDNGAAASLWQTDHGDPPVDLPVILVEDTYIALQQLAGSYRAQLPVRIIGITGSNGKTTTKDLTSSILSTTYKTAKTEGNLNNHIGLPLTLLKMDETIEMAVLEMGMSGRGEIELLSQIAKPEAVIITNIGESHLRQLGSREEIALAKLEICSGLKEDGLLIFNGDEPLLDKQVSQIAHPTLKCLRFGASTRNDYYPTGIMADGNGYHFTINIDNMPSCYIPLLGKHNVINAIAAIAVSRYMGVQEANIIMGLKRVQMSSMRIELTKGYNGVTILNDAYNSSPTSLLAALQLLEELKGYRKKVVVIGDMLELGEQEQQYHKDIGKLLKPDIVDYVFTYGQLAQFSAKEAAPRYAAQRVKSYDNKESIAQEILNITNSRDLVLIKGSRGMKLEEVVSYLTHGSNKKEGRG